MMSTPLPLLRPLLLLISLLTFVSTVDAQPKQPERATLSLSLNADPLRPGAKGVLAVVIDVKKGFHAQSSKPYDELLKAFKVIPAENTAITFGQPLYADGRDETYPALGKLSVYTDKTVHFIPYTVSSNAPPGKVTISVNVDFQICDDSTCFRPEKKTLTADLTIAADAPAEATTTALFAEFEKRSTAATPVTQGAAPAPSQPAPSQPATSPAKSSASAPPIIVNIFGHEVDLNRVGVLIVISIAMLAGLAFNIMPCVLPVLPLKAMGFYEASGHHRSRTILFGAVFSLGLIAVFAGVGSIVVFSKVLLGSQLSWGQWFSNPYFVWGMAIFLVALGIGMMGFINFNLPTSVYGVDFRHDTLTGNFMWGILTAVLSTPCTAFLFPPIIFWAITQPAAIAMLAMLSVGVGMALPYFILSAFPEVARNLPRTGPFSELFKQMLGFCMIGAAAFFAGSRIIEGGNLWLVFAVAAWASVYLVARTVQLSKSGTGVLVSSFCAILLSGVTLKIALPDHLGQSPAGSTDTTRINWVTYTPEALARAQAENKIVIVKFTADWCSNCHVVERTVFTDARTIKAVNDANAVVMKLDVDKAGWDLLNSLAPGGGIPFTAVYPVGVPAPLQISSIYGTEAFLATLKQAREAGHVAAN